MKKSANLFFAVAAVAIALFMFGAEAKARITGYLYGDALVIGYPGTTVASIDTTGALAVVSATKVGTGGIVASTSATSGQSAGLYGAIVTLSTSATSGQSAGLYGAIVTLSTVPTTVGQIYYQTSDNKLYVSTRVPAANVTYCIATGCWAALN